MGFNSATTCGYLVSSSTSTWAQLINSAVRFWVFFVCVLKIDFNQLSSYVESSWILTLRSVTVLQRLLKTKFYLISEREKKKCKEIRIVRLFFFLCLSFHCVLLSKRQNIKLTTQLLPSRRYHHSLNIIAIQIWQLLG